MEEGGKKLLSVLKVNNFFLVIIFITPFSAGKENNSFFSISKSVCFVLVCRSQRTQREDHVVMYPLQSYMQMSFLISSSL